MVIKKQLNGVLKATNKDFIADGVKLHLLFPKKKNQLPDKSVGLKNGSSAKEHYKSCQMKAANQSARCKGYLKII